MVGTDVRTTIAGLAGKAAVLTAGIGLSIRAKEKAACRSLGRPLAFPDLTDAGWWPGEASGLQQPVLAVDEFREDEIAEARIDRNA
jgi:hypothetical protein